jgi:hypothetical protein
MEHSSLPSLALSIQAPWSWLIIRPDVTDSALRAASTQRDIKDVENRTWDISEKRGILGQRVCVHVGLKFDHIGYAFVRREFPHIEMPARGDFPLGGIIGTVKIADCVRRSSSPWFFGPWGFVLEDPQPCDFIACPGALGFFDWRHQINRRLNG